MANKNLQNARKNKNDEFYTQLTDIEKELSNYRDYFKNKTVFLNCDDPKESNFWRFFELNFEHLELKKLIATHYVAPKLLGLDKEPIFSYTLTMTKNSKDVVRIPIKGNGDFRSPESIELLKEADIVVTNPPFSLFRPYIAQLIKYDKRFIIIGNLNAIAYKDIFPLIRDNKIWLGVSIHSGDREFGVPSNYPLNASGYRTDEDGNNYIRVQSVRWFTNLKHKKQNEEIILYKKYNEKEYPKYDNYDAINVDKVKDIPDNYYGEMGVPITFLEKYNPDQFEIIALGIIGSIKFSSNRKMEILKNGKSTGKFTFNAKGTLYRKHNKVTDKKPPAFKDCITGELYQSIYARIIIKRL